MSVHSTQKKRRRDSHKIRFKTMGNHDEFLDRITKTLYYAKLPATERFSLPVTELAAELYSESKSFKSLDRLRLEEAAKISRNACTSPCSLVLAMIYLDQLKACNPHYVDRVAPSELFFISLMVASKFLHDTGEEDDVSNGEWAVSAGVELKELNVMEREFLDAINWEVFVKESLFWTRLRELEKNISLREGKKRGWFSYTELENLLDIVDTKALAQAIIMVSIVCMTSYTAGVLTMIGSTYLVSRLPSTCIISPASPLCRLQEPLPSSSPASLDAQTIDHVPGVIDTHCLPSNLSLETDAAASPSGLLSDKSSLDLLQLDFFAPLRHPFNDTSTNDYFLTFSNYFSPQRRSPLPLSLELLVS